MTRVRVRLSATEFPKFLFHKVACIGALVAERITAFGTSARWVRHIWVSAVRPIASVVRGSD